MFIIATSGRCGTEAICRGLGRFSDHIVEHEPAPVLLKEAWLKNAGLAYQTADFDAKMQKFAVGDKYGESFRAPNLLADIREKFPKTKFLIVVRSPLEYVVSAHFKRVLSKGNAWDRYRIMPAGSEHHSLSNRIALHWAAVNDILLRFADETASPVMLHQDWNNVLHKLPEWLGVEITHSNELKDYWSTRPNRSTEIELPTGYNEDSILEITNNTWYKAIRMSGKYSIDV